MSRPTPLDVQLAVVPPVDPTARRCLEAYFRELAERFENGFDPTSDPSTAERDMVQPHGAFVIACIEGHGVGCGGFHCLAEHVAEIKRMWSRPRCAGRASRA